MSFLLALSLVACTKGGVYASCGVADDCAQYIPDSATPVCLEKSSQGFCSWEWAATARPRSARMATAAAAPAGAATTAASASPSRAAPRSKLSFPERAQRAAAMTRFRGVNAASQKVPTSTDQPASCKDSARSSTSHSSSGRRNRPRTSESARA